MTTRAALAASLGLLGSLLAVELALQGAAFLLSRRQRSPVPAARPGTFTVLCLGESTTAPRPYGPDYSWPAQLQARLDARGADARIINKGAVGTNSAILLARLPGYLDAFKPDLVVTMIGANDDRWFAVADRGAGWRSAARRLAYSLKTVAIARYAYHELWRREPPRSPAPLAPAAWSRAERLCERERDSPSFTVSPLARKARALAACRDALAVDPDAPVPFEVLGYIALAEGRTREAVDAYTEALRRGSTDTFAFNTLADHDEKTGRLLEAEAVLRRSIGANPSLDEGYRQLAALYERTGRSADAARVLREAAARDSDAASEAVASLSPREADSADAVTRVNYRRIRDLVLARGIPMIAMQYPRLDAAPLRRMLGDVPGVTVVSNVQLFELALAQAPYSEVFTDRFGGSWGHMTARGCRLLAEAALPSVVRAMAARGRLKAGGR